MEDSPVHSQLEESQRLDTESTELENLAIEYLSRYAIALALTQYILLNIRESYVQKFDTNRADLSGAYAENASFSYSIHNIVSPNSLAAAFTNYGELQRFASRKSSRNLCT